jgi:hypothetical protein
MTTSAIEDYLYRPFLTGIETACEGVYSTWELVSHVFTAGPFDAVYTGLLRSHTWVYHPDGAGTKAHFLAMWALGGRRQGLLDYQDNLPALPIPSLDASITNYLESVRPLLTAEAYEKTCEHAKAFTEGVGWSLDSELRFSSWSSRNWLEELWLRAAYLRKREPLPIGTNWYCTDSVLPPANHYADPQVDRLGRMLWLAANYCLSIDTETLPPAMIDKSVPLDMHPFTRIFGTTRIPGEVEDRLETHLGTSHAVVLVNGHIYPIHLFDVNGAVVGEREIRQHLRAIRADAATPGPGIGVLTAMDRTTWARERTRLMAQSPQNAQNIQLIESALFVASLDDESPGDTNDLAHSAMQGVNNRWFDKSFQLIAFRNGRIGGNIERSWADAAIVSSMHDDLLRSEGRPPGEFLPKAQYIKCATPLRWDLTPRDQAVIDQTREAAADTAHTVELQYKLFAAFGAEQIQRYGIEPDAFIQMAIQRAYHQLYRVSVLSHETAETRIFYHGRTDSIRSTSTASKAMCEGLDDRNLSIEQKQGLIRTAVEVHAQRKKDALAGRGSDRHLMALRITALASEQLQGASIPFFEDPAFNLPFKIATSQTTSEHSAGGGFTPLCKDGYGISYHIAERTLGFHVSSTLLCPTTSSAAFADALNHSLQEMSALLEYQEQA